MRKRKDNNSNKENNTTISNIEIFKNVEFGSVRVATIKNEPYFVGKDIAEILGYVDSSSAVSKNVDDEDKTTLLLEQDGSNYKSRTTLINESGLYSLILSSKLPMAKKFKRWVTSEVLPMIRKSGGYINKDPKDDHVKQMVAQHLRENSNMISL